ncbi:epidermis-specific secreted glycoprotein EP1-like [Panicum virgatum]|uniref:epidermis-specific secreted glycoprotein EP1-like n=1 Tax=Panicum virgatum TaxID=38727 RepID=UPI0019D5A273|nr:epidermis-specific secreted glycoprotein EP1-like [Panicum virgatum]
MEEKSAAATTGRGPGQQTAEEIARETRDMLRRHCEEQRARDQLRDLKLESLDIQVGGLENKCSMDLGLMQVSLVEGELYHKLMIRSYCTGCRLQPLLLRLPQLRRTIQYHYFHFDRSPLQESVRAEGGPAEDAGEVTSSLLCSRSSGIFIELDPFGLVLEASPSPRVSFAACFYCAAPCADFYFGVCIIQVDSGGFLSWPNAGTLQVVWSANRDRAVRENATLSFTAGGDLLLRDTDGSLVWSTRTSDQSVAGMTLTKSGNLVLFYRKNAPVWESFSHPADCLLPGQQLVEGMRLTPNASATNWTTNNQLYVTVRADGLYAFVESSPPQLYYQKTVPKSGNRKTYMTLTNDSVAIFASSSTDNVSILETGSKINMTAGGMMYMRLESDGHLKLYQYKGIDGWTMTQDILKGQVDDCAYPTVCGEYGICTNGQCTCPIPLDSNTTYFKQTDNRRINLGCMPVTPISCASMQDHQLLALSNVSYFNYVDSRAALPQMIDEESCKNACLRNCSCKAAFFQYSGNDTSKG